MLQSHPLDVSAAEAVLGELAEAFFGKPSPVNAGKTEDLKLEDRYQTLLEQIPAVVFMALLDGTIGEAYVSPHIEKLLGFSRAEWIEDPINFYRQIHPDDKGRWSVEAAGLFISGEPLRSVYRVMSKTGRVVWFQCDAKMVRRQDGTPWFIHGVGFDITELKQIEQTLSRALEAAQAADRAKSEFLSTMSHELRTPLNGILGMTEVLTETDLTSEQTDYLGCIQSSGDNLLTIVNDILDFSKIEARRLALEMQGFDLGACLEKAVSSWSRQARVKSLTLSYHAPLDIDCKLLGDPLRLSQIVGNLIDNAIKFTERGSVTLRVDAEEQTAQHVLLHFQIADTGIGIPPAKHKLIFDPFTQVDGTFTRKYGGSGLGLTIAARLAELMDGHMWVESELGRGSTFHFTARFGRAAGATAQGVPLMLQEPSIA